MSGPIQSGYYALVPSMAFNRVDELPVSGVLSDRLITEIGKSSAGFAIQDHDTIDGLFWAWKLMSNGWIMLLLGDKAHRSDTPGDAFEKCRADMEKGGCIQPPLSVMWIGASPEVTMH